MKHPLLGPDKVSSIIQSVYDPSSGYQSLPLHSLARSQREELFQFNMVLAIGSIHLFRNGTITMHPFGFFTAALQANPLSECSFSTIDDVENLLLIAHFGFHYNIGSCLIPSFKVSNSVNISKAALYGS